MIIMYEYLDDLMKSSLEDIKTYLDFLSIQEKVTLKRLIK